ncbi:flagellar motor protein MotB [Candidatus Solirubrobacter pratensis]|uniref:flagellar motor protein MotB n=1 Tax=Candidatus Solirubrobacter pratensis TaxID=1298857 RepID=UPI000414C806|nr:flagellar motor protein MotB [Candidatus Solirubrobacter pratensis]
MARHRRRGHEDHEVEHDESERWLVSFADMMTLLFALFMVLFSISSVNTSKFEALQKALQDAFSGRVLSGGKAIMQTGSDEQPKEAAAEPPLASLQPLNAVAKAESLTPEQIKQEQAKAAVEQEDFRRLKRRIDELAAKQGLQGRVTVTIRRRGLIIQLLTDKVFFDSGQAVIKPQARKLLDKIAVVIRDERTHPIDVEGHTDSQPIHTARYGSNFGLSGDRAAAVVDDFIANGVLERRLSTRGLADKEPLVSNSTAAGRSKNRRVEVVLARIHNPE